MSNKYHLEEPYLALSYGSPSCANVFLFLSMATSCAKIKAQKVMKQPLTSALSWERERGHLRYWGTELPGCSLHRREQSVPADVQMCRMNSTSPHKEQGSSYKGKCLFWYKLVLGPWSWPSEPDHIDEGLWFCSAVPLHATAHHKMS